MFFYDHVYDIRLNYMLSFIAGVSLPIFESVTDGTNSKSIREGFMRNNKIN